MASLTHSTAARSSRVFPFRSLTPFEAGLLSRLADPDAVVHSKDMENSDALSNVLVAARLHGVMAIIGRKLASSDIVPGSLSTEATAVLLEQREQQMLVMGQSMLLEHHAHRLEKRFAEAGVAAEIVKGPSFAKRLYKTRSDRPFTDIDFLVAMDSLPEANKVISGLGFTRPQKFWDNAVRDQEYKWLLDDNRSVLIELHGNLVHYPALRRHLSFGYAELMQARKAGDQGRVADIIIAVVHSACGHKFHRLNMLVDVLQAARCLTEPDSLKSAATRLGATLEVAVTLGVVGDLFDDDRLRILSRHISQHGSVRLGRRLVSPETVLSAQSECNGTSRIRRHLFRQLQQFSPARP